MINIIVVLGDMRTYMMMYVSPMSVCTYMSRAKRIFKSCGAVCFDVDSTVIQEEGVDILAAFSECGDEVAGGCEHEHD